MSARADSTRAHVSWAGHASLGLRERLKGPGGLYNLGNAIGLAAGLLLQARNAGEDGDALAASLADYFFADPAAVALTLATLAFFWSGEEYHRAFLDSRRPDARRIRLGDLLSGVGAVFLGAGLLMVGDPLLAATSGLLHAAGKFGSAFDRAGSGMDEGSDRRRRFYRSAVVASRLPASLIGILGVAAVVLAPGGATAGALLMPVALVVCYGLWTAADLMLLRPA